MKQITNPVELFSVVDGRDLDQDEYPDFKFFLGESDLDEDIEPGADLEEVEGIETVTVEHEWMDEEDLFDSALDELEDAVSDVPGPEDLAFTPNASFSHNGWRYFARSDMLGYEVIRDIKGIHLEENLHDCVPRKTGFAVLYPENVARIPLNESS